MPAELKLKRPATRDHLSKKKPRQASIPIVLDDDALEAYRLAEQEYEGAKLLAQVASGEKATEEAFTRLKEAEAALDAAAEVLEANVVVMKFQAIGRKVYDALLHEHPPTDQQVAEAKERGEDAPAYNFDTFAPALIAASCITPDDLTIEDVQRMYDEWNTAEIMQLWVGALAANSQSSAPDLGKAYG